MMDSRIWTLVSGAAIVAVLAGGYFLGVQPQLAAAATADQGAASAESTNQALQVKLAALAKLGAQEASMRDQDAVLQKAVPEILKPNTLIRRINEVAALHAVTVKGVTLGAAAAYTVPDSLKTPATTSTESGTATSATAAPATVSTAPSSSATASGPKLALTNPLITTGNFVDVPVTVSVSGTEQALLAFSTAMQNDQRVFLINGVSVTKDDEGGAELGTLTGYVYTLKR